jgi:hypothetical protein
MSGSRANERVTSGRIGSWFLALLCFLAVCAVFVAAEHLVSGHFEQCYRGMGAQPAGTGGNYYASAAGRVFRQEGVCTLRLIDAHNGFFAFLTSLAVAAFALALWISTHRLWIAGTEQLAVGRMTADAAVLAQRAQIQITPTWETDGAPKTYSWGDGASAKQFKFGSRMDNVGNLPASNLKHRIDYHFSDSALPAEFAFPDETEPMARGGVLGANRPLLGPHVPRDRYITGDEMEQIRAEKLWLYLFGWVTYSDGFSHTPLRTTRFCYFVRVTGNPEVPVVFIPHKDYNSAD